VPRAPGPRCSIAAVIPFHVAAALFALLVLARHGRRALALLDRQASTQARTSALVPLIACAAAVAVLLVAVKGLALALMNHPGGTP
jgi:hypothetical protein